MWIRKKQPLTVLDAYDRTLMPGRVCCDRWFLPLLVLLATGLRIAVIASVTGLSTPPVAGSDDAEYDRYAWNVAQGRGYRGPSASVSDTDHVTAYRPPMASLYYAAIFTISGHSYAAARIANAVLGGLTVILIAGIGRRCFDTRVARIAAAIFTFAPAGLFFSLGLESEAITALLVALVVWCSLRVRDHHSWLWSIATGVTFGLLLLCKPGFLFVLPLLPFWAWAVCGRRVHDWLRIAAIPVAMGLVILPWVIRNLLVMGAFIPFGTGGGQLLLSTSNRVVVGDPQLYGYSVMDHYLPEYRSALFQADDEVRRDRIAQSFAVDWLKANPDKWFYLVRNKFVRFWEPLVHREPMGPIEWAATGYGAVILIFMVGALPSVTIRFWGEGSPGLIIQAMLLGNTIMAMIFHGQPRYRFPIESLCILLASAGVAGLVDQVRAAGGIAPAVAALGRGMIRRRPAIIMAVVAVLGYSFAVRLDAQHIEAYRDEVCENRLHEINRALGSYEAAEGRLPTSLGDLVPRYLPNMDSLHCPKHSLRWQDYILLSETDARQGALAISYALVREPGAAGVFRVEETEPRHHGSKKSIIYSGSTQ